MKTSKSATLLIVFTAIISAVIFNFDHYLDIIKAIRQMRSGDVNTYDTMVMYEDDDWEILDNWIDDYPDMIDGFSIIFPIKIITIDDSTQIIENQSELELLKESYHKEIPSDYSIKYPIDFVTYDNRRITLNSNQDWLDLPQKSKLTGNIIYPINAIYSDKLITLTNDSELFKSKDRMFVHDHDDEDFFQFVYPITLKLPGNFNRDILFYWTSFLSINHIIVFLLFAFINLSLRSYINKHNLRKVADIFIVSLSNLFLLGLFFITQITLYNFIFSTEIPYDIFMLTNIVILGITLAEDYFIILTNQLRESELEKIKLREEKTTAELTALKDQISPHFFFNTLSSLSSIVRREDKDLALEFIQKMSNTYRYTLASKDHDLISIHKELEFIDSYLFILRKRFGEKLDVLLDDHCRILKDNIPPMSIQILIENAIQHNVITKLTPLVIKIFVENDMIVVENNVNRRENSHGFGLGLKNLRNRYILLANKEIEIESNENKFLVRLPLL
jgi:sensor histidine kinase YesM